MSRTHAPRSRWRSSLAAILIGATSLAACGGSSSDSNSTAGASRASSSYDDTVNVIMVSGPLVDPFFGAMKKGADQAAKDLGVDFQYSAPSDLKDVEAALKRLTQAAVAKKPDALLISDFFPSSMDPELEKAKSNGTPVVLVNSGEASTQAVGAITYVGQNELDAGRAGGEALAAKGVKHGLCVNHAPGNPTLQDRCDGFKEALEGKRLKYKQLDIPTEQGNNPTSIQQAIKGAVTAEKSIDGVFTLGAAITEAGVKALEGTNVKLGAADVSKNVLTAVKDGKVQFVIDQQAYLQGYYGVLAAAQHVRYALTPGGAMRTGPVLVDQSNVQTVIDVASRYAGLRGGN
jgi:simple sugar transport system substrate-binding protein